MIMQRHRFVTILAVLAAPVALAALLASSVQADDLPEGPAKELILKVCTPCHGVAEFTSKRNTKQEWNDEVDKMAARGAKASDEEFDAIVEYLTKYFGKEPPVEKNN